MPRSMMSRCSIWLLPVIVMTASAALAQFTASIQGEVQDPTGAGVAKASIHLVNTATGATSVATSDDAGNYRFVSLAPGRYRITVEAAGFEKSEADVTLLTEQNLNLPIRVKVGSVTESVVVSTEAPVVDTADSRTHLTLESQAVEQLPIVGRNLVTLVTMAPGVSGLGTSSAGSPASGVDNYSTEEQVDASANGQGQNNNQYVVDGLDVTSGIRQGVLNLTPQPDSIQETAVQVNTFTSEYSRAAGLQTMFTTRSGANQFHGSASDYFNYQGMFASQHFVSYPYLPFHSNNMDFSIGGPVIPHHDFYFYFAVEPLRSSGGTGGKVTFADPAFITWAQGNNAPIATANTVGTGVLANYRPANLTGVTPVNAASYFGSNGAGVPICQADPASVDNIPCDTNVLDSASFGATSIRNGTQYFARIDKDWKSDRVYVSLFRTLLLTGAPSAMPQFSALNNTWQVAGQASWTHTFSPTLLNEFTAGQSRVEGVLGSGAPATSYYVPSISVNGINVDSGQAFGVGFAQGDFIQHNYHWRDVLTHVKGAHTLKFGYEGWYGDDVEPFQGPWSQPKFSFNNLLTLAEDSPTVENGIYYNPATGTEQLWSWDAASRTFGLFVQDTWKARKNLTLTLGLRYDDSGNPWSKSPSTVFGNFYLGTGNTEQQQVTNGYAKATQNALLHSVNNLFSPRIGVAWDPTGNGDWVVRGGFGIYNNWLTQANVQEEFRGSPPGEVAPTFFAGGTASAQAPIFVLGNSNKPPFGFTFPTFGPGTGPTPQAGGGLDAQGGIVGAGFAIGAINPLLKSPKSDIWSVTLERKINHNFAASVGYNGSHSYNIVGNGNSIGNVSYGVDINAFPGDLMVNNSTTPTRLNPSFGAITYANNDRYANYNAVIFDVRGHFARGFVDASYTRSRSQDDSLYYPDSESLNPQQYYATSIFDAPNRFSLSFNYQLKGLHDGRGAVGYLTGGWGISGTSIFQSGYPLTPEYVNSYQPVCGNTAPNAPPCPSAANPAVGYGPSSGDFLGDGDNLAYPDVASYSQSHSNGAWLTGGIPKSNFTAPAFSNSGANGNEKPMQFRGPNFAETDLNFYKDTHITERVTFQFRFEIFNFFNRANYVDFTSFSNIQNGGIDMNLPDSTFGQATSSHEPRFWQLGGKISF